MKKETIRKILELIIKLLEVIIPFLGGVLVTSCAKLNGYEVFHYVGNL